MRLEMRAAAALAVMACGPVRAFEGLALDLAGGLAHRTLRERAADGTTLLTERGAVGFVRGTATAARAGGAAWQGELALLGGDLDYNGQTQSRTPLQTSAVHHEWAADLRWRPLAPAAWGELWATAGWLENRRHIAGTPAAGGLRETSKAVLLGVRWTSPAWTIGDAWHAHLAADARASAWHRLEVDYFGLLDASRLHGAGKRQLGLRLTFQRDGSPWSWDLSWSRLAQAQSDSVPVFRQGTLYGTVRQPALRIEDAGASLTRHF